MNVFQQKWFIISVMIPAGLVLCVFMADIFTKGTEPRFYTAPETFCNTRYSGITLPPVGIFICAERFEDERLRAHEMVHWDIQYRKRGSLGFYLEYLAGWLKTGFNYENHPMEIEAREKTKIYLES